MIYGGSLSLNPDRDWGWIRQFRAEGWDVVPFSTDVVSGDRLTDKVSRRFQVGRSYGLLQGRLLSLVRHEKPSWVHFRLPLEIRRATIGAIKLQGVVTTEYFNDDPFSPRRVTGLHRTFREALPEYDAHFVYRALNLGDFELAGARRVEHCGPTYDPDRHFLKPAAQQRVTCDAAFIGHWEDDWRSDCLQALVTAGVSLTLKGGGWNEAVKNTNLERFVPITHAFGSSYNDIYASAAAGLCFFSKINRDMWTERAVEIIAVGGVLVCERTPEAATHFRDGEEAFFFASVEELVAVVTRLANDPSLRERVRKAGHSRLLTGGHSIKDRARQITEIASQLVQERGGVSEWAP